MPNYICGSTLQRDVYSLLASDETLAPLVSGVHDAVPPNPLFPFITISEVTETADNTLNSFGRTCLLNLHVWSDYDGNKEAQDIISAIVPLMDKKLFSQSDAYEHVSTHFLDYRILKEEAQGVRHGIIRFRIYTSEKL